MVAENTPLQYLIMKLVLPTAESPANTILNIRSGCLLMLLLLTTSLDFFDNLFDSLLVGTAVIAGGDGISFIFLLLLCSICSSVSSSKFRLAMTLMDGGGLDRLFEV